ncbi:MAG TPA: CopG family transcriptional regulator [Gammaproteobacteria bacterium]|nr:CopG family transcriptional regulator [Gammaproteobacteria bacterium]
METKVVSAHIPLPLAEKVKDLAQRLERSKAWVDQEEERHRLTLEALADVDSGNVIEHQTVQVWAESLDSGNPLPLPVDGHQTEPTEQLPT